MPGPLDIGGKTIKLNVFNIHISCNWKWRPAEMRPLKSSAAGIDCGARVRHG
jgi:hypothetical protein